MQYELMSMQNGLNMTFIYVTHDQEEALTMADRIAVMDRGKVLQIGRPEEIYETPNSRFVADFIGETNFIEGSVVETRGSIAKIKIDETTCIDATCSPNMQVSINQEVTIAIRPEKMTLIPARGVSNEGESYNFSAAEDIAAIEREEEKTLTPGVVKFANYIGTDTRYIVQIGKNTELIVRIQNFGQRYDTLFKVGQNVMVFWATENARVLVK
jgi:spermidine/putrescine transport system ATP-binding protein